MNDHDEDERICRRCSKPMTGSKNAEPGERRHVSRGLCSGCYYGVRKRGELDQYPRLQNSREAIVKAFVAARKRNPDVSQDTIAQQLGIPRTTLAMNLRRAVELGDSRITKEEGVLHVAD